MRTLATRKLLAATGLLLWCGGTLQANDLRFTDIERRLATLESQSAAQQGVLTAAYSSHSGNSGETAACSESSCCQTCVGCNACSDPCGGRYFGEVHLLWIRPHVSEDWVGKLSESHDFSTRYVLGYEDCCGLGGRARFWHYKDHVTVLDPACIRTQLDVLDLEVTNRYSLNRTDIVLGGGFRYAGWELADDDWDRVELDAFGLTLAADLRTALCCYGCNQWSFVYGGRLSVLAGDWRGDNDIIDTFSGAEVRDDNLLVHELYAGIEYVYRHCGYDLITRAAFEMQNWHSDVLSEPEIGNGLAPGSIGSTGSIGFIGPSFQMGLRY